MTDLDQRMKELDVLQPPDLWLSIEARSERPRSFFQRLLDSIRLIPPMQVAAIAVALVAIIGVGVVITNAGLQEIETADQPGQTENEKAGDDETGGGQTTEGDPADPDSRPSPRAFPGSEEPTKDSQSGETPPAGENPRGPATAGPPIHYTDQADDAYSPRGGPPNAELNQREFDILRVDWGPVSYVNEESPGGYFTSITVAGSARPDGEYISEGQFDPARTPPEGCWLAHFLTPGTTAYGNAFCEGRFVGRVEGGPVASTPTPSGGTRLTATFDNRTIPAEFEAARNLHNLAAYTCPPSSCEGQFLVTRWVDRATSALTYRV
jgi:hypothetical protein